MQKNFSFLLMWVWVWFYFFFFLALFCPGNQSQDAELVRQVLVLHPGSLSLFCGGKDRVSGLDTLCVHSLWAATPPACLISFS